MAFAGRQKISINYDNLKSLSTSGLGKSAMSAHLGVSRPTLDRLLSENELDDSFQW